jgi:hypothetical protein
VNLNTTTTWGPATVLAIALSVIGAVAGAIVAIVHPATLSFSTYLTDLLGFAGVSGVTAIGHGILNNGTPAIGAKTAPPAPAAPPANTPVA